MKQRWIIFSFLLYSFLFPVQAMAQSSPGELLRKMQQEVIHKDYELIFMHVTNSGGNIESFRYRNARFSEQNYAQLLPLDGPVREILLRGSEVSYFFQIDQRSFSIAGDHIIDDVLPAIMFADFNKLSLFYKFNLIGSARIADELCKVIRISTEDGFRYNYVVWINEKNLLPMQIELHDINGDTIQQFRVLSFISDNTIYAKLAQLSQIPFPPQLFVPINKSVKLDWHPTWTPQGFKEISSRRKEGVVAEDAIETLFFSDGLFSFSISKSIQENESLDKLSTHGARSLYSETRGENEIMVVGDLPLTTMKRVAQSVVLYQSR